MQRLRHDAEAIWRAGVAAVDSARLVERAVRRDGTDLVIGGHRVSLGRLRRLVVVGAGKAGAGMAAGLEQAVGDDLLRSRVTGWINVPADCVRPLRAIHLHPARPAGVNEPTEAGVAGSARILELARNLGPDDVCVVLLSGGGSALLPAPVEEVTLADKQAVTRLLMHAGAPIDDLNRVRKHLSQIKGGRLAQAAAGAGLVVTLIISDVIGDPLDVIASGPTVPDPTTAAEALSTLRQYAPDPQAVPQGVWDALLRGVWQGETVEMLPPHVHNHIIGSNATALTAAAEEARRLGYRVHSLGSDNRGEARSVGRELAALALSVRDRGWPLAAPACLLSGGEPVVRLVPTDQPRKGGRNQEVALAALDALCDDGLHAIVILSGGTDGEDGPTDAAGAVADADVWTAARQQHLVPADFLAINNAYPFFDQTGGLLRTGPTHTNVMDVRVVLVGS